MELSLHCYAGLSLSEPFLLAQSPRASMYYLGNGNIATRYNDQVDLIVVQLTGGMSRRIDEFTR